MTLLIAKVTHILLAGTARGMVFTATPGTPRLFLLDWSRAALLLWSTALWPTLAHAHSVYRNRRVTLLLEGGKILIMGGTCQAP